jgi:hypothetical protein
LKLDQRIAVLILFVFFSFVNWPESTDNANIDTRHFYPFFNILTAISEVFWCVVLNLKNDK